MGRAAAKKAADKGAIEPCKLGIVDKAESKRIAWCAIGSQFVKADNKISPMRLRIGNLIKEALP